MITLPFWKQRKEKLDKAYVKWFMREYCDETQYTVCKIYGRLALIIRGRAFDITQMTVEDLKQIVLAVNAGWI